MTMVFHGFILSYVFHLLFVCLFFLNDKEPDYSKMSARERAKAKRLAKLQKKKSRFAGFVFFCVDLQMCKNARITANVVVCA